MSFSLQKNIRQAEKLIKLNKYKEAEDLYLQILEKFPNNMNAQRSLKKLKSLNNNKPTSGLKQERFHKLSQQYNRREFKEVIKNADDLIKIYPKESDLYNIKGASNAALGMFKNAITCYEKILQFEPDSTIACFNIAVMYDNLEAPKDSIKYYKYAIKNKSDYADAYNNMGSAYKVLGKLDDALQAYNKVININPNHVFAHNNIGNIYLSKQLHKKAIESFKKAIFIDPKYADAMNNLGNAYKKEKRFTDAHKTYSNAISINPNHTHALKNIADLHARNNDYKKSIPAYKKALASDPNNITLLAIKLSQQAQICDIDKIKNDISKVRLAGIKKNPVGPFTLTPFDDSPERHLLRAKEYTRNRIFQNITFKNSFPNSKSKPIRLGYISSDFKNHPVSQLLVKVIELHSRDIFKVYGYSIDPRNDDMTERLKKAFDVYEEFGFELNDRSIASCIKKDKIDILIDLNGYTKNSRPGVLAYRPAKLQINFLGFPATMGADFIDYIIADQVTIPNKFQKYYNEAIIRLPDCYMPTDNTRLISNKSLRREEHGLPKDSIVFCCFNNNYKISSIEFDIWMRILSKFGGSVLWLREHSQLAKENLYLAAERRGVDRSRIIFAGKLPMEDHLARHALADIFLDTFNFNAHTTACDALWSGLPIVTKIGKSFAARVAGSLLTAIGLTELITNSELEYEKLIIRLASNPKELKKIKQKLNKNLTSHPLFDSKLYTCNLEKAYEKAYENLLKEKKPENISIEA